MPDVEKRFNDLLKTSDLMSKNELTDEELDDFSNTMNDIMSDGEIMEDYQPTEEDLKLEKDPQKITVNIDPITGKINNVLSDETIKNNTLTIEQLLNMEPEDIKSQIEIPEDNVKETLDLLFPDLKFKAEDIKGFLDALNRYRKGEKISYYNILPESIKKNIDMIIGHAQIGYASQREARNYVIEGLFDQIIQENYTNMMVTDFDQSLEASYKQLYDETKGEFSKYNNNQRYIYETYILEYADKIEEEHPEKAESCRKIHDMFVQSYTYEDMYNMYKDTGKLRVKKIEIEKFEKTCKAWLHRYSDHKMVINNLIDTFPVLKSELEEFRYSDDTIKKFIILFTKYTMNMSPDNIEEHVFMYYFIKNILSLKYHNKEDEEEVKFYDKVRQNIIKFLNLIEEKDQKGVK